MSTHTLTFGGPTSYNCELIIIGGDLTITGQSSGKIITNGNYPTIATSKGKLTVQGELTIENQSDQFLVTGDNGTQNAAGVVINVVDGGTLDITGTPTVKGTQALNLFNGSTATIKGGTFTGYKELSSIECAPIMMNNSTATIDGGTFTGAPVGIHMQNGGTLNVNAGTIKSEVYNGLSHGIFAKSEKNEVTTVNISGNAIVSGTYAVSGVGKGVDINISGGNFTGTEIGVQAASGASAKITDSADVGGRYGAVAHTARPS